MVFIPGQEPLEVCGHAAGPPGHSVMSWIRARDARAGHARLAAAASGHREPAAEPRGLTEIQIEDPGGARIVLVEMPRRSPSPP
jgi:hypothetical protein